MFNPGDLIGPYTLVCELGQGQFGLVWLAKHGSRQATGEVALKVLKHPDANRILQEVLTWARGGDHPNILPILDARPFPTLKGELPIIVTTYVREGSLREWLTRHRPASAATTVEVTCGILEGLEHLHRKSIVHRDLKPENVLMYQDCPLLTDFGLASYQSAGAGPRGGGIAGTIEYMAPESFRGEQSPQVDVWAVAVMCYEMVAGHRPFPRDPRAITTAPLPPLPGSVPEKLRQVLRLALRQDIALRSYTTATELRAALLEAVGRTAGARPAASRGAGSTVNQQGHVNTVTGDVTAGKDVYIGTVNQVVHKH